MFFGFSKLMKVLTMVVSQILLNGYWIQIKSMDLVLFRTDIDTKFDLCTNFQKKHNDGAPNVLWIFKVHKSLNNGSEAVFIETGYNFGKMDMILQSWLRDSSRVAQGWLAIRWYTGIHIKVCLLFSTKVVC